jgi:hypothetical protein
VQTRTHLTSPPGQGPTATSSPSTGDEVYVPGLAVPEEPKVPGRYRRVVVLVVALVLLAAATYLTLQVMTMGEDFDPALDQLIDPGAPADEPASEAELPDS